MVVDYVVKKTGNPWRTRIYEGEEEVAEIRGREDLTYLLTAKDGNEWMMTARVHGQVTPFSMTVNQSKTSETGGGAQGTTVLTIRDSAFFHNGKFYMLAGTPEGRPLKEFLLGKRYICRVDSFPFSDLAEIDHETRSRLRRFRGSPVGELTGLGADGHQVHLSDELEDISLPLAASCYLIFSTA